MWCYKGNELVLVGMYLRSTSILKQPVRISINKSIGIVLDVSTQFSVLMGKKDLFFI
jgi:hypothetical protein